MAAAAAPSKEQQQADAVARLLSARDPREALGFPPMPATVTEAQVKRAFRDLALLVHPDKCHVPRGEAAFKKLRAFHDDFLAQIRRCGGATTGSGGARGTSSARSTSARPPPRGGRQSTAGNAFGGGPTDPPPPPPHDADDDNGAQPPPHDEGPRDDYGGGDRWFADDLRRSHRNEQHERAKGPGRKKKGHKTTETATDGVPDRTGWSHDDAGRPRFQRAPPGSGAAWCPGVAKGHRWVPPASDSAEAADEVGAVPSFRADIERADLRFSAATTRQRSANSGVPDFAEPEAKRWCGFAASSSFRPAADGSTDSAIPTGSSIPNFRRFVRRPPAWTNAAPPGAWMPSFKAPADDEQHQTATMADRFDPRFHEEQVPDHPTFCRQHAGDQPVDGPGPFSYGGATFNGAGGMFNGNDGGTSGGAPFCW